VSTLRPLARALLALAEFYRDIRFTDGAIEKVFSRCHFERRSRRAPHSDTQPLVSTSYGRITTLTFRSSPATAWNAFATLVASSCNTSFGTLRPFPKIDVDSRDLAVEVIRLSNGNEVELPIVDRELGHAR
jgi:hypothetical protein